MPFDGGTGLHSNPTNLRADESHWQKRMVGYLPHPIRSFPHLHLPGRSRQIFTTLIHTFQMMGCSVFFKNVYFCQNNETCQFYLTEKVIPCTAHKQTTENKWKQHRWNNMELPSSNRYSEKKNTLGVFSMPVSVSIHQRQLNQKNTTSIWLLRMLGMILFHTLERECLVGSFWSFPHFHQTTCFGIIPELSETSLETLFFGFGQNLRWLKRKVQVEVCAMDP